MEDERLEVMHCETCGAMFERAEESLCPLCFSDKVKPGARVEWVPWNYRGKRMAGFTVALDVIDARRTGRGGHVELLCKSPEGRGSRWLRLSSLTNALENRKRYEKKGTRRKRRRKRKGSSA